MGPGRLFGLSGKLSGSSYLELLGLWLGTPSLWGFVGPSNVNLCPVDV